MNRGPRRKKAAQTHAGPGQTTPEPPVEGSRVGAWAPWLYLLALLLVLAASRTADLAGWLPPLPGIPR